MSDFLAVIHHYRLLHNLDQPSVNIKITGALRLICVHTIFLVLAPGYILFLKEVKFAF